MSGSMNHFEAVAAEIEKETVFQPEVYLKGNLVQVTGAIEGYVVIPERDLGCRIPMGGDESGILEIAIRTDMIQVFVRVDDQLDVLQFQS